MSGGHQPSWERIVAWLVVGAISLQILARVLPKLLVPLIVLTVLFVVVRVVLFHTRH
jgi:uncharacterized membrane protein YhhN